MVTTMITTIAIPHCLKQVKTLYPPFTLHRLLIHINIYNLNIYFIINILRDAYLKDMYFKIFKIKIQVTYIFVEYHISYLYLSSKNSFPLTKKRKNNLFTTC